MAFNFKDFVAINGKKGGWVPPPMPKNQDLSARRPSAPDKPAEFNQPNPTIKKEPTTTLTPREEPVPPKPNPEKEDFERTILLKLFERHSMRAEDIIKRKIMFDRLCQNDDTPKFIKTKILESLW